jgi:hypothetical protein
MLWFIVGVIVLILIIKVGVELGMKAASPPKPQHLHKIDLPVEETNFVRVVYILIALIVLGLAAFAYFTLVP